MTGFKQLIIRVVIFEETIKCWGNDEYPALMVLLFRESGINPYEINKTSGACGLFQSINCDYELGNVRQQMDWGCNYIKRRYSTPSKALQFQLTNNYY